MPRCTSRQLAATGFWRQASGLDQNSRASRGLAPKLVANIAERERASERKITPQTPPLLHPKAIVFGDGLLYLP